MGKGWRVWAPNFHVQNWVWYIDELEFYEDEECAGDHIDPSLGTPIHSNSWSGGWGPENAFGQWWYWGGQPDEHGAFWLGLMFNEDTNVQCAKLYNADANFANELRIQVYIENEDIWKNVWIEKDLDTGISAVNTMIFSTSLTSSPSPTTSPTPCDGSIFSLQLLTDLYGVEITWTLTNQDTSNTVFSGGPYGNELLIEVEECINEGCYVFVIVDSAYDGICCGYGTGNYVVNVDGEIVQDSTGDYGPSETTLFCTQTQTCVDSGLLISYQGGFVTCAQVATADACSNPLAASHCPLTCDVCDQYKCADSLAPFQNQNTCDQLASVDPETITNYCTQYSALVTTCRDTCDFCNN